MKRKQVKIINEQGLHARAASLFVAKAGTFSSDIDVLHDDARINAKSIMGVMSGGIGQGETIIIEADGDDEDEAIEALTELVDSGFKEA